MLKTRKMPIWSYHKPCPVHLAIWWIGWILICLFLLWYNVLSWAIMGHFPEDSYFSHSKYSLIHWGQAFMSTHLPLVFLVQLLFQQPSWKHFIYIIFLIFLQYAIFHKEHSISLVLTITLLQLWQLYLSFRLRICIANISVGTGHHKISCPLHFDTL